MIEYTLGFELKTRPEYTYIWFADLIFITFTLLELILKVGSVVLLSFDIH